MGPALLLLTALYNVFHCIVVYFISMYWFQINVPYLKHTPVPHIFQCNALCSTKLQSGSTQCVLSGTNQGLLSWLRSLPISYLSQHYQSTLANTRSCTIISYLSQHRPAFVHNFSSIIFLTNTYLHNSITLQIQIKYIHKYRYKNRRQYRHKYR